MHVHLNYLKLLEFPLGFRIWPVGGAEDISRVLIRCFDRWVRFLVQKGEVGGFLVREPLTWVEVEEWVDCPYNIS